MDPLLRALRDLHIKGTKGEELRFEELKRQTIDELREDERRLFRRLATHHKRSWKHSFMVMHDAGWLAERLGVPKGELALIKLGALGHDVGKLDIHPYLLNLSRKDEVAICKRLGKPLHGNLTKQFTLYDMILCVAEYAPDQQKARAVIDDFEQWLRERKLDGFLHRPAYEYLRHHQPAAERLLHEAGVDERAIRYATTHHPEYLSADERQRMPRYAEILSIADKFNAMIQSEGVRLYARKKLRCEALLLILQQLKKEFKAGIFHPHAREALAELAARHLPQSINEELLPDATTVLRHLREALKAQEFSPDAEAVKEAQRLAAEILAVLSLSRELHVPLSQRLVHTLDEVEEELRAATRDHVAA